MKSATRNEVLMLAGLFLIGILFRLWFISLAPQPFGWDQYEYETYAGKMLGSPWFLASHSYRPYPYPLFLALLYRVFGFGNHGIVIAAQAIVDSATAVLLFLALRVAGKRQAATVVGFLYALNPFTSGYVGVLLSEVLSAFFMALTLLLGVSAVARPSRFHATVFGVVVGLAAHTRSAAFAWAVVPVFLAISLFPRQKKIVLAVCVAVGLFIPTMYPLSVNVRDWHEISLSTVDSTFARELFNGAILRRLPPFTYSYPLDVQVMYGEYYSEYDPGRTSRARKEMAKKYIDKAWIIIKTDPWDYIKVRFQKMWYVWQKENLFFYEEPGFERRKGFTYVLNLAVLSSAVFGIIISLAEKKGKTSRWIMLTIIGTILYGTIAFSFTHAEYRLTIPLYPYIIVASGIAITRILGLFRTT
ncbi:MAG: glycosyltransferase family 39 protein [bacterium]|nr:glycosyltransferase family 39 protein [bacterium]